MMADDTAHRSGPLKRRNKEHKTGRHRTKGVINSAGKAASNVTTQKCRQEIRKEYRRNQLKQLRKCKRQEIIAIKRQLGSENTAPFLVCVIPMHENLDPRSALSILENCHEDAIVNRTENGITYINIPKFKQRFTFITPPIGRGNEFAILDYLKVADTTLLLTSAVLNEGIFDKWGHRMFDRMAGQGIPTPIVAVMDLESINPKKRMCTKAAVQKFISKVLPNERIMQLDTRSEGLNVMRRIGGQKKNNVAFQNNRPHLFGDDVEFVPDLNSANAVGTLKVTGFLRGTPLDVNGLVHLPDFGDFQISQIDEAADPFKRDKFNIEESHILALPHPKKQTSLQSEVISNPMDCEQNWLTEEEIKDSQTATAELKHVKYIPKGWSNYQSAWIPDIKTLSSEKANEENYNDSNHEFIKYCNDLKEEKEDDYFSPYADNSIGGECQRQCSEDEEFEETSSNPDTIINDENYDLQIDMQEEKDTLRIIKQARADQLWPDEINTPMNVPARERFKKFRGLESFRTSPWDPKENLPSDYSRIYQFKNFSCTKKRIIAEAKENNGVLPGLYITIHISGVSQEKWFAFKLTKVVKHIIVFGLLPHEHQMSVMHVVLKRIPDSEVPIKSKEPLIVQCGFRRFVVNPVFSQHTNGDKHKFERFFRPHETVCATFYAPIQFPPVPVLAFKKNPDSSLTLVARGCILSCNPDRVILKRVVLSGHPMRINRRSATIRYMFFNKEDVDYFKPVKLHTKCGRLGHIKESLGTHGHMKCYFDGQLRSYDTVFMYLYKRVYPKWNYEECGMSLDQPIS